MILLANSFGHTVTNRSWIICQKSFVPVTKAGEVFIWENFQPGYRDLGITESAVKSGEVKSRKPSEPG